MDTSAGHSLQALAIASGIPVRTLRYYLAQGLLPAPVRQGRLTRYPDSTLRRLALVKRLRAANLPLAEIRDRLAAMPDTEVEAALGPRGFAKQMDLRMGREVPPVYLVRPPTGARSLEDYELPAAADWQMPPSPDAIPRPTTAERSQWERIFIEPGVELHVQRPLTRLAAKRVERLVAHARDLIDKDLKEIEP